jgi:FtsZ-binding cell division protein ZapB
MAVVRARSAPPYGLFAAVTFAVLATAAAVVFYLLWSKASVSADEANTKMAQLATLSEQKTIVPTLAPDYGERNKPSAIAQINTTMSKLNDELKQARASIATLTSQVNDLKSTNTQLNDLATSAGNRAKAAETQMGELQRSNDQLVSRMQDTQAKLEAALSAANGSRDVEVKKGQDALNAFREQAEDERRKLVLQLEDAQSQIARNNAEIFDLRQRIINFGSGKSDVSVGEADGKVIRVNGTTGEVYINLGKKDRLMPGMPFTAYDPRLGVRFGTDESAQGNGSLEVIEVGDTSSICRITRTSRDRAIQNGDLIANIIYHNDRTRKFRFTVFGDFDLDGDGIATAAERDRLITLINAWGGQVDDSVSSQTDYLVLGEKPKSPMIQESADTETATEPGVVGSVAQARSKDQDRYEELEISAKRLAIPVLNQNRFLAMVGYYNTTVVRY